MSNRSWRPSRFVGAITLLTLHGLSVEPSARATCYNTPLAAIDTPVTNSSFSPVLDRHGYRVTGVQLDPVLGQRWAMIDSCEHPEWPAFVLPMKGKGPLITTQEHYSAEAVRAVPLIRAGDIVRLWKQENFLRIEIVGVSEESGGLGKTI